MELGARIPAGGSETAGNSSRKHGEKLGGLGVPHGAGGAVPGRDRGRNSRRSGSRQGWGHINQLFALQTRPVPKIPADGSTEEDPKLSGMLHPVPKFPRKAPGHPQNFARMSLSVQ